MKPKLIVGNWKMNGSLESSLELVNELTQGIRGNTEYANYVICPPAIYLKEIEKKLNKNLIKLGAQDVSEHNDGAYTGQISSKMLKDVGCEYVIIGHSERRQYCFETDQVVANKFLAAINHQITPIVCVGESLAEREANQTEVVVLGQLSAVIEAVGPEKFATGIIAYEPIWAIGTGKTASPQEAQAVHAAIRKLLETKLGKEIAQKMVILYGGSVKSSNAASLFQMSDIDGALIGGASLSAKDFLGIGEAVNIA